MDSWPANDRKELTTSTGRKSKTKRKENDVFPNYPDVIQGSLNAITLAERDYGFEWLPIVKSFAAEGENRLHIKKSLMIFPPTRSPTLCIPQTTVRQRAEHGANFLRTFLPDVDIPAELIRDEIVQDARTLQDASLFDPYIGNLLEPVVVYDLSSETTAFLAFPMGELNCDLNISAITHTEIDGTSFKASVRPVRTYNTPIQQITSSKAPPDSPKNSVVAVRTFEFTSFLKLVAPVSTIQYPQTIELGTVHHADVGNRSIVDIKLCSSSNEGLAVNDRGQLYRFTFENGFKAPYLVHTATVEGRDFFWRVETNESNTCLLMSKKELKYLDFRTNDYSNLSSISSPRDVFTSVEDDGESNIVRLCSTREILWIDKRFPAKPLLGYRHNRNWDRSLLIQTLHMPHAPTSLTSRTNGLVTLYDISRSKDNLLHLNTPPYYLWPRNEDKNPCYGQAFFRHPLASHDDFNMFQLLDRGSVLQFGLYDSRPSNNRFSVLMSEETDKLEQQASALLSDDGPLGCRDFSEVDFVSPYNYIFCTYIEKRRQAEEESAEAFHDLLDQTRTFWRKSDVPIEQILTTYDVLFRIETEPIEISRANFLTEGLITTTRGYYALTQGRLSSQYLIKDAAWCLNLVPILRKLSPYFPVDAREWNDVLRRHDLRRNSDYSIRSSRREKEAREQLILDLSLSADVFSAERFSKISEGGTELEEMTKTLSIIGEPPNMDFGYFRPIPKNANHYIKSENVKLSMSLGARMLIKEWRLGGNPDTFQFRDHYNRTTDFQEVQRTKPMGSTIQMIVSEPPGTFLTQSQRPPLLAAAMTLPLHRPDALIGGSLKTQPSLTLPQFGSQIPTLATPTASQEYMTSTQVLPGPYGGRPSIGKKKLTKKRLGGF